MLDAGGQMETVASVSWRGGVVGIRTAATQPHDEL